jgi:hypothetical protein
MEARMTTPHTRTIVSLVTIAASLALGACAGHTAPPARDGAAAVAARATTIRFDNEGRVPVRVYLIGAQREWSLGRVEQGARATLRIPAESLEETAGLVRLAVIADAPPSAQAALDPRSIFAMAQPMSMILSQRWTYSQPHLASPQLFGARRDVGHR